MSGADTGRPETIADDVARARCIPLCRPAPGSERYRPRVRAAGAFLEPQGRDVGAADLVQPRVLSRLRATRTLNLLDTLSVQSHELREFKRHRRGLAFEAGNRSGAIFNRPILTQFELCFTPGDRDVEPDDGVQELPV
jgi:hypothetical protein